MADATPQAGPADLVNLADTRFGATMLYCTDDFFASMDNLLRADKPIFIDGKYTDRGKWMDGWESRRKRVPGHDYAIMRLGVPGVVRAVVLDTAFFRGNYPQAFSLEGASIVGYPSVDEIVRGEGVVWTELVPKTNLEGDKEQVFEVPAQARVTHLRLHIYPDGGVARMRVLGDVLPHPRWMGRPGAAVDLAQVEHGARVVACNDMFFGSRHNLIMPNRAANMGDGWETKRSRREGPDWVLVQLACAGVVERVVLDTLHFKGNSPESAELSVADAQGKDPLSLPESAWTVILPRKKLLPHTEHTFDEELVAQVRATHARLRIWPDGGVSRMRLFGPATADGREASGLGYLNALANAEARAAFLSCAKSTAWAEAMLAARPFASLDALHAQADAAWAKVSDRDYDDAFSAHPRIGERKASASAASLLWSRGEQAKVDDASDAARDELARVNAEYEKKFGRTYIVCATGRTAEEMLEIAKGRLGNDAKAEFAAAAAEQRKITALRLDKLVIGHARQGASK